MRASSGGARDEIIGIPLTKSEAGEIRRRGTVASSLAAYHGRLSASSPTRFGGGYIDQAAGGVVRLWFKDASDSDRRAAQEAMPPGTEIDVLPADFSVQELLADSESLAHSLAGTGASALPVSHVVIDDKTNRVTVSLRPEATEQHAEQARSGRRSVVVGRSGNAQPKYSRFTAEGRYYAGRYLKPLDSRGFYACTNATSARNGTAFYIITAGHCGLPQAAWQLGYSSPVERVGIGRAKNQFYQQTRTACDCQLIGPIAQYDATNQVFTDATNLYSYGRLSVSSDFANGTPSCASGFEYARVNSGRILCGQMGSYGYYVTKRINDGVSVIVDGQSWHGNNGLQLLPGDSGSAFGNGPIFLGVESGGDDTIDYFARSYYIQPATDGAPIFSNP